MADAAFAAACEYVKNGPKPVKTVPNSEKLKAYALYKQATEGDVKGSQPWAIQLEKRAKWDAWNAVKGMVRGFFVFFFAFRVFCLAFNCCFSMRHSIWYCVHRVFTLCVCGALPCSFD